MSPPLGLKLPFEVAYRTSVLFAVELVDAATLERVSQGITVTAEGLRGKPVLNSSGLFVWLRKRFPFEEDFGRLRKLIVEPGVRPYEYVERPAAEVTRPLTTIELPPRIDYPFSTGLTGLRGTLIESLVASSENRRPVPDAIVTLRWLDEDDNWQHSSTQSHTDINRGDFVSFLRLTRSEKPKVGEDGLITVRLRVSRDGARDRHSTDVRLLPGRISNPSSTTPFLFAWDDLQP